MRNLVFIIVVATAMACHGGGSDFRCHDDSNCDLSSGGKCITASTGNMWCAYPDLGCPSGLRFTDTDVGDNLAGMCTDPGQTFKLTVSVAGSGTGTIASNPDGISCTSGTCTFDFPAGTQVNLAPTPSNGVFLGFNGACVGFAACSITMDQDRSVNALFGLRGESLWVHHFGDTGSDRGTGLAADSDGNIIATGYFAGTMTAGAYTLTANMGSQDMYLVKIDSLTGDILWAKSYGGQYPERSNSIALDTANNIYVVGDYSGTADFGNNVQTTSAGSPDIFVAKFSATGDAQWARSFGGVDYDFGVNVAVRGTHVAATGYFRQSMVVNNMTFQSQGNNDTFLALLTTDGDYVWLKALGAGANETPNGLAIDSSDNVILAGRFSTSLNVGGSTMTSAGGADMFLAKYSGANGTHLFSKQFGSTGGDIPINLTVDTSDNIVLTGTIGGSTGFGGASPLAPTNPYGDTFLVKLSSAGAYQWGKVFASTGDTSGGQIEYGTSVATNSAGDVALVGYYCGTISFGSNALSSASSCGQPVNLYDAFAARFSSTGDHLNSVRVGGTGSEFGQGVAITSDGRYFMSGDFEGFADFGTGQALTSNGMTDAFVLGLAPL